MKLCPHLQPLLDAELTAGNTIRDEGPSPAAPTAPLVLLARPFAAAPAVCPDALQYAVINDPHWWLAEYRCREHHDVLACAFH